MLRRPKLPDPDENAASDATADVVIYDGQCNFCTGGVNQLSKLDCCGNRLTYLSLHDPRVAERYPDLTHDQLMQQMYVVDTKGRRHGGADAVRYLSRRLPLLWLAAPMLHIPGTAGLWRWGYNQVAKRRYKLAGKTCENDACEIHMK